MNSAVHRGPVHWVVAGALGQVTGGYLYDRAIVEGLRGLSVEVRVHELAGRHPLADDRARSSAQASLSGLPDGACVVVDGLALPACEAALAVHAARLRIVALVHHPLALETGLTPAERDELDRSERAALGHVRRILTTSATTARNLAETGVAAERVGTVPPGCDSVRTAGSRRGDGPVRMLCVATVTPRKGHLVLIDAVAGLREAGWHLDCVGSLSRDPPTVESVRHAIDEFGLEDRVTLHDERPAAELDAFYREADLFVLPSFHEGYGMVLAEALSHGLPVVGTTAGAIPEVVPPEAGVLVPPGNVLALRTALARLLRDPARRAAMAEAAAHTRFPNWAEVAGRFAAELDRLD